MANSLRRLTTVIGPVLAILIIGRFGIQFLSNSERQPEPGLIDLASVSRTEAIVEVAWSICGASAGDPDGVAYLADLNQFVPDPSTDYNPRTWRVAKHAGVMLSTEPTAIHSEAAPFSTSCAVFFQEGDATAVLAGLSDPSRFGPPAETPTQPGPGAYVWPADEHGPSVVRYHVSADATLPHIIEVFSPPVQ